MVLWSNSKPPAGTLSKLLPVDLVYLVTHMREKEKKKGKKSGLTRENFLSPTNSECLI